MSYKISASYALLREGGLSSSIYFKKGKSEILKWKAGLTASYIYTHPGS